MSGNKVLTPRKDLEGHKLGPPSGQLATCLIPFPVSRVWAHRDLGMFIFFFGGKAERIKSFPEPGKLF